MSIERIIGIDFGTSTSVIRVKRYEDKKPVGDRLYVKEVKFGNNGLVPTLIQHIQDGEPYYGYDAQKKHKNSVLLDNFKVDLESMDAEKKSRARALTEEFFTYLAGQYKDQSTGGFFGETGDIERTLVSYPVKWSAETRSFMLEAARKAGFPNVEGMDEAQAAIGAVMVQSSDYLEEKGYLHDGMPVNILMADMGAGTTDLVLCRYTPGAEPKYEVLSTWPKEGGTFFGGREMDELLREYLKGKLPAEDADAVMRRCGTDKFKSWKEEYVSPALKRGESVTEFAEMDNITELLEIDVEEYALDRTELEKLAVDYLRGFPRLVNGCLKDAGILGSEVDLVLLTGGHSQWYFVAELLSGRISQCGEIELDKIQKDPGRIIPVPLPQETVALGLVYSPMVEQIRFAAAEAPFTTKESVSKTVETPKAVPIKSETTLEQLRNDMVEAMKLGDKERKNAISSLVSAVKNAAIEEKCRENVPAELVAKVIIKELEIVNEQLDICPADREDLRSEYQKRYDIIAGYVSKKVNHEEETGKTIQKDTLKQGAWSESERVLPVTSEEEFEFREFEDGYEVAAYLGDREVVSIPSQYRGKPVLAVGEEAFNKKIGRASKLETVEIPGSCYYIKKKAFKSDNYYISLEKVILHCGLIGIGEFAFYGNIKLQTANLPEGLDWIGMLAFGICDLREVLVPASCHTIGESAFGGNHNLDKVIFSSDAQIEELYDDAFLWTKVYSIKLPVGCTVGIQRRKLEEKGIIFNKKPEYIRIERY